MNTSPFECIIEKNTALDTKELTILFIRDKNFLRVKYKKLNNTS